MNSRELIYAALIVLCAGVTTILLRAFPFIVLGGRNSVPPVISYLGKVTSPAAIGMLIVYCYCSHFQECGLPGLWGEISGGATVILLQLWRNNPLLSILAGTAVYMLFVQLS